jgi:hypothetical protein
MSKIKGLAIRATGAGQGGAVGAGLPPIGGQAGSAHHILGDIFARLGDSLHGPQYLNRPDSVPELGRVEKPASRRRLTESEFGTLITANEEKTLSSLQGSSAQRGRRPR